MDLREIFQSFSNLKVLIVGDIMLDSYVWGNIERISPEAPVPVVTVQRRDHRLGGAANVALNIFSLGATPLIVGLVGNDEQAAKLRASMERQSISTEGLVESATRPTSEKTRVIANNQHVVRVDGESDKDATTDEARQLLVRIESLLPACHVVIFEDYNKGVLTPEIIEKTVALARQHNIPTVVDPKKRNFLSFRHVTLFKPNLKELREGLKTDIDAGKPGQVEQAVTKLKEKLGADGVMATLSEHGVYIDFRDKQVRLPAHARKIADVSGAGDTVIAIAALSVAMKLEPALIATLSNLGGGLVCQQVGVVPIDKSELLREALAL